MAESIAVACRLPHGLHLDNYTDMPEGNAPHNPEARVRVTLNGANKSQIIGGAGITFVEKSHWETWLKRNTNAPFIKNGAVFVAKNAADASAEAMQRVSDKTGFEQAKPEEVDPRIKTLDTK